MKKAIKIGVISGIIMASAFGMGAHTMSHPVTPEELDTIREKVSLLSRINFGGYGEAVYNYNFSSTAVSNGDALYEDSRGHGSLDIPRIVIMLGVNLGKGWGIETDVQFENCKSVSIDQFWIEKVFRKTASLRVGYLTLPVGLNAHDDPLEFFAVNRPEGEDDILPCDWHQAGLSFFGEAGDWNYEAILIPGINTDIFSEERWVTLDEAGEKFTYRKGHCLGFAGRVENNSIPGLRVGVSGYWGITYNNRLAFINGIKERIKGNVGVLSLDFLYDDHNCVLRGNGTWGRYSKSCNIISGSAPGGDLSGGAATIEKEHIGKGKSAFSASFEGGYDMFGFGKMKERGQKLYLFGRYDYYQQAEGSDSFLGYDWGHCQRVGFGLNYFPIENVVVKGEYSHSFIGGGGRIPMVSVGVAYSGEFF
ncbi:MAG: hypothetical protein K2L89_05870 [Muribaculaceae bacterium]|nr:hypothetical protein [Muribaculaceae bacterium]